MNKNEIGLLNMERLEQVDKPKDEKVGLKNFLEIFYL